MPHDEFRRVWVAAELAREEAAVVGFLHAHAKKNSVFFFKKMISHNKLPIPRRKDPSSARRASPSASPSLPCRALEYPAAVVVVVAAVSAAGAASTQSAEEGEEGGSRPPLRPSSLAGGGGPLPRPRPPIGCAPAASRRDGGAAGFGTGGSRSGSGRLKKQAKMC